MSLASRISDLTDAIADEFNLVRTEIGAGGGGGTKISELGAATTPLGATDKFVIVQGGTTKQVEAKEVIPTPWVEVPLILGTTAALTPAAASAAVNIELYATSKATRNKLDLSWATQIRLVAVVISNGNNASAAYKISYATTEASTWASGTIADAGASIVLGTGTAGITRDSGWQTLVAGARIDNCVIAATVGSAMGNTAPTIGAMSVFFR